MAWFSLELFQPRCQRLTQGVPLCLRCATSSCPLFCPFSFHQCLKFCGIDRLTEAMRREPARVQMMGRRRSSSAKRESCKQSKAPAEGNHKPDQGGVSTHSLQGEGCNGSQAGGGRAWGPFPFFPRLCLLSTGRHYFGHLQ